jgi:hypothetical protein
MLTTFKDIISPNSYKRKAEDLITRSENNSKSIQANRRQLSEMSAAKLAAQAKARKPLNVKLTYGGSSMSTLETDDD